jgi:hypothetical protein
MKFNRRIANEHHESSLLFQNSCYQEIARKNFNYYVYTYIYIYIYMSVFNATYYLALLLCHYTFRPYVAIIVCKVSC